MPQFKFWRLIRAYFVSKVKASFARSLLSTFANHMSLHLWQKHSESFQRPRRRFFLTAKQCSAECALDQRPPRIRLFLEVALPAPLLHTAFRKRRGQQSKIAKSSVDILPLKWFSRSKNEQEINLYQHFFRIGRFRELCT